MEEEVDGKVIVVYVARLVGRHVGEKGHLFNVPHLSWTAFAGLHSLWIQRLHFVRSRLYGMHEVLMSAVECSKLGYW